MKLIDSGIKRLRDPFILVEDDAIYAYGGNAYEGDWVCHRNTSRRLDSGWEDAVKVVKLPEDTDAIGNFWAPEVHKYNGAYYMFTTYKSKLNNHRGSVIFRSESPMGPFVPHSKGHLTPFDWDCIDATLYIDADGQPWMVFVHEWTCMPDHVGNFSAAKLSDDLTHLVSEPIELFRADAPDWATRGVTDGCFMYTTRSGSLLMIWSNFASDGYAVGIARSDNGRLDGNWTQEGLLFSKALSGKWEGGHGMIFELDGQLYISLHAPNTPTDGREEMPTFIPLREENDTLICE